jgi:hypothetical protein
MVTIEKSVGRGGENLSIDVIKMLGWLLVTACAAGPEPGLPGAPDDNPAQRERDLWWQRLHWSDTDCPREAIDEETSGVRSYALANGRTLIEITCFLGGVPRPEPRLSGER